MLKVISVNVEDIRRGDLFWERTSKFCALEDAVKERPDYWKVEGRWVDGPRPPMADEKGIVKFGVSTTTPAFGPDLMREYE
jgi:hypothetical protein